MQSVAAQAHKNPPPRSKPPTQAQAIPARAFLQVHRVDTITTPARPKRGPVPAKKWDNADLLKAYQAWQAEGGTDTDFATTYGIPYGTLKTKLSMFRARIQAGFHPLTSLKGRTGHDRPAETDSEAGAKQGKGDVSKVRQTSGTPPLAPLVVSSKAGESLKDTVDAAAQLFRDAVKGTSAVSKQRLDAAKAVLQSAGLLVPQASRDEGSEFRTWTTAQLIEGIRAAGAEITAGRIDPEQATAQGDGQAGQLDEFGFPIDPLLLASIPEGRPDQPTAEHQDGHAAGPAQGLTEAASGGDTDLSIPTTLDGEGVL